MIRVRTALLVLGILSGLSGALAQECSEEEMQDSFEVSFEKNRRTGEIKSLDVVEVTFDYGKVQHCVGSEEPTLHMMEDAKWEEVAGGRKRRNTWSWTVVDADVKPCKATAFMLVIGDQQISTYLDLGDSANDLLVEHNYRLGAPEEIRYLIRDQVIEWNEVECATGYHIEMVDQAHNIVDVNVTENRLSSGLADLAPCEEMDVFITPYVINSENRNSRDEAVFRFEKFPDFSQGFLDISDVTSNSVDMKMQLDSLRCVESLSVAISEQDSYDSLDEKMLHEDSDETFSFENLNQETDYEIKIVATPFEELNQDSVAAKVLEFKTLYDMESLVVSALPSAECCSVDVRVSGLPSDHDTYIMERSYDGESWERWEQYAPLLGDGETDAAKEPVCTEIRYRVTLTIGGQTIIAESEPIRIALDDTMDLGSVGQFAMERIEEGNKMEVIWSDIPCIESFSVKICTEDGECEEETHIEGTDKIFVREVDPCREYTVTITPNSDEYHMTWRGVLEATATRQETVHISHKIEDDEVIFFWEPVQCVTDFEFTLVTGDGADNHPRSTSGHEVSYSLSEFLLCGEYRASLDGEFHGNSFSLADNQGIGVISPVGDYSQSREELNLEIQGTKMTWSGSACAESYRVTVTDDNADTVFSQIKESSNADRITVELENLEECKDYKAELETIWKDVSLPGGQFSAVVVPTPIDKLPDANNCRAVNPRVKSSSLKLPNVSSASTFDNSVILLLVSTYAIYKVFRV